MEQQFSDYYEDLLLLSDCLGEGVETQWSHELRKQLLLLIHKLKNISRKLTNSEIEAELIAIEVTLGFGTASGRNPDTALIVDHQLRLLELSTLSRNDSIVNNDNNEFNDDINIDEQSPDFENETVDDEKLEIIETDEETYIEENKQQGIQLILCNCPGRDAARELAHSLVKNRMAACINIIANIGSIYWWEGEIQDTAECQLQIKTGAKSINDVISFIKQNHPNDMPEILIMPIVKGNEEYFDWVREESH